MANIIITLLFFGLMGLTSALAPRGRVVRNVGLPGGFPSGHLTWTGAVVQDGPNITVSGASFKSIELKLIKQYQLPTNWTLMNAFGPGPSFPVPHRHMNTTLKIDKHEKDYIDCNRPTNWWDGGNCQTWAIREGITYLKNIKGDCTNSAYWCERVSCSYNAAIWNCNFHEKGGPSVTYPCADIGWFAEAVVDECAHEDEAPGLPTYNVVHGAYVDKGQYGAVVGDPRDGC